jgi:hypothetical protein
MRSSPIAALALLALTGCFSLPTSSPVYASYESYLAYEPTIDELRWIEVMHGGEVPLFGVDFFAAFQQGRRVYPADSLFCFDLDRLARFGEAEDATAEHRFLADVAAHVEILDGGLFAESEDRIGVWRRTRIHRASELVPGLNALLREWFQTQSIRIGPQAEPMQETAAQRVRDSLRDFLRGGGDLLRLDEDRLVLELPIPSDVAVELNNASVESTEAAESGHLVQLPDGRWVWRSTTTGGWLATLAVGRAWHFDGIDEAERASRREDFRDLLLESGQVLSPKPELETLKSFEPVAGP